MRTRIQELTASLKKHVFLILELLHRKDAVGRDVVLCKGGMTLQPRVV